MFGVIGRLGSCAWLDLPLQIYGKIVCLHSALSNPLSPTYATFYSTIFFL